MESNLTKYINAFVDNFEIDASLVESLEYQSIQDWDSVGHMGLIAHLEEAFNIQIEMDDVIDINSFKKGMDILKKYGVHF